MHVRYFALVVVVACSTGTCTPETPTAVEPVLVGLLYPETGPLSEPGPHWRNAAALAAEDINAIGGIVDGRPLKLIALDTATDPERAASLVAEHGDVLAFAGPVTSSESEAILPIATEAQQPFVSCCATSSSLTGSAQPTAGYFFRTAPSDDLQGAAMAYVAKNGASTPALASCPHAVLLARDDAYGRGFADVFLANYTDRTTVEGANTTLLHSSFYGADANQQELRQAATDAVDGLAATLTDEVQPQLCAAVIGFDIDSAEVILALDAGLRSLIADRPDSFVLPYHFLVADGANSGYFADAVAPIASRVAGTVPFHSDDETYDHFRTANRIRFGDVEPLAMSAQMYDATMILALGLIQTGGKGGPELRDALFDVSGQRGGERVTPAQLGTAKALLLKGKSINYAGPSGGLTFDAFGNVVGDYVLWFITPGDAPTITEGEPLRATAFAPTE